MNEAVLHEPITSYNDALQSGAPDPRGRLHRPLPLETGPFYAIEHVGWSVAGFAGIAIDTNMRVIKENGDPIPGLYAAGEIIGLGQTSGNAFVGGMSVTPSMTFGRLVGSERGRFHASTT